MFDPSILLKTKKKPSNNPPLRDNADSYSALSAYTPPEPEQLIQPPQPSTGTPEAEPPIPISLKTRERTVAPPMNDYEKAVAFGKDLQNNPNLGTGGVQLQKPSRLKSALIQALSGMGQGANRALETGNVGWAGLGQAIGGGIGGGVVGAAAPGILLKARHQQAIDENLNSQQNELTKMRSLADIKRVNADAEATGAQKSTLSERVVGEGEYVGVPKGTSIRVRYNSTTGQMEDLLPKGKPVISKAAPVKKPETVRVGDYVRDNPDEDFHLPKGVPAPVTKETLIPRRDGDSDVLLRRTPDGKLEVAWKGAPPSKDRQKNEAERTSLNTLADSAKDRGDAHIQAAQALDPKIAALKQKLAEEGPETLQIDKDATEIARAEAKDPGTVKPVTKRVKLPVIPQDSPLRQQLQTELNTLIQERQSHEKGMEDAFKEMQNFRGKANTYLTDTEGTPTKAPLKYAGVTIPKSGIPEMQKRLKAATPEAAIKLFTDNGGSIQ